MSPPERRKVMVERGYSKSVDVARRVLTEISYGRWRQFDAEDTVRFFALRLNQVGMIASTPQKIIAQGADWRFVTEVRKELKG